MQLQKKWKSNCKKCTGGHGEKVVKSKETAVILCQWQNFNNKNSGKFDAKDLVQWNVKKATQIQLNCCYI